MTERLRCRGWQQEAALRMLENNLHPDVAEKPEELVVYGGIGKAARDHAALAAIKRELQRLGDQRDAARPVRQAGRRLRDARGRAARADRQLQPRRPLGELGDVPGARRRRADDVRPDDRRVLDLHRDPGDPPGHLRDVRRGRPQALRRHAQGAAGRHRRARRDGRRAAARGDDERGVRAVRGGRPPADRAAHPRALPRRSRRLARRRAGAARRGPRRRAARSRSGSSATPPRSCPSWSRAASRSTS